MRPTEAADGLEGQACETVRRHYSPQAGTPFWLDHAREAGWNPAA